MVKVINRLISQLKAISLNVCDIRMFEKRKSIK